jgi:hypothetical protein
MRTPEATSKQNGSPEASRLSKLFLDLRELTDSTVAVRVRPQHAEEVWQLLRLRDSSIEPLTRLTRHATEYLERDDGLPYLDGDWDFIEIRTRGPLKTVTIQLAGFFMLVAERIHTRNKT